MRRVTLNGLSYAMPYLEITPPHSEDELTGLESSILANGILDDIDTGISPTHGRIIIDGATRAQIAEKHDLEAPVRNHGDISDEQSRLMAETKNADRRHLSLKAYIELRVRITTKIAALRAKGKSVRAIAEEMQLPRSTVQDRLSKMASGVRARTPEPEEDDGEELVDELDMDDDNDPDDTPLPLEPTRVTGRDGKSYLATKAPVVVAKVPADLKYDAAMGELAKLRKLQTQSALIVAELLRGPLKGKMKGAADAFEDWQKELEAVKA